MLLQVSTWSGSYFVHRHTWGSSEPAAVFISMDCKVIFVHCGLLFAKVNRVANVFYEA